MDLAWEPNEHWTAFNVIEWSAPTMKVSDWISFPLLFIYVPLFVFILLLLFTVTIYRMNELTY